jgi:thioredoxin 1|tara:strand:- start:844 stop:1110 length:267 start_codon:yes stop_codon:yes gene_type:complete
MVKTAIKFYADWCGPCKTYDKVWQEVKLEMDNVKFLEINVDKDESGLAAQHNVRSIPHTVILRNDDASVTASQTGLVTKRDLKDLINK